MTTRSSESREQYAFLGLAASLGIIQLHIFGWIPLAISLGLWLTIVADDKRRPDVPGFFLPLMALAAWTLVSCAFSSDPAASFYRSRQLLIFLIVPLTMRVARGSR